MTQGLGKGFGALRQQADQATANLTGRSPKTPGSGSDPGQISGHFSGSAGGAQAGAASAPPTQRCAAPTWRQLTGWA